MSAAHPRFEERGRDVAFGHIIEKIRHAFDGPPATAAWRLEQRTARAPIFRAVAAGQLTSWEFHRLHGLVSLTRGYEIAGKVQRMSPSAAARLLGEIAKGMPGWTLEDEMAARAASPNTEGTEQ
jgi:hypothetical protein